MYRVYSGPRGSEVLSPTEKIRNLYKEFGSLDEAIGWAHHVNETGRAVLLIEGDDGTHIDIRKLVDELIHRNRNEPPPGVH
ncbi:MAG: hypothetical protein HY659_00200 [Rhizobiales bacterium]|nr:hypothetical protein [Hyphomicrobiales bacterium]